MSQYRDNKLVIASFNPFQGFLSDFTTFLLCCVSNLCTVEVCCNCSKHLFSIVLNPQRL